MYLCTVISTCTHPCDTNTSQELQLKLHIYIYIYIYIYILLIELSADVRDGSNFLLDSLSKANIFFQTFQQVIVFYYLTDF